MPAPRYQRGARGQPCYAQITIEADAPYARPPSSHAPVFQASEHAAHLLRTELVVGKVAGAMSSSIGWGLCSHVLAASTPPNTSAAKS